MEPVKNVEKMELSPEMLRNLNTTRKWTMFLSVIGFIFFGFLLIFGLVTSTFLSYFKSDEVNLGIPEALLIAIFIAASFFFFIPVLFLFRFSRNVRDAVHKNDTGTMRKAFRNLRNYFMYIGIALILVLSLYIMTLIRAGAAITMLPGA